VRLLRPILSPAALVLTLVLFLRAVVPAESAPVSGTILEIQKQSQYAPRTWLWNTVVFYSETVSYRLRIQSGNQIYVAEYVPLVQPTGPYPTEWKPGAPVTLRIEKRSLFVELSYGGEVETTIVKRER